MAYHVSFSFVEPRTSIAAFSGSLRVRTLWFPEVAEYPICPWVTRLALEVSMRKEKVAHGFETDIALYL
jgi:hypothetical protein